MGWFRTLFAFDALALLALGYFFVDGLRYTPDGDYFSAWAMILGIPIMGLAGARALKSNGKTGGAVALLAVLAAPAFLYLLFVGLIVFLAPDFR